MGFGGVVGVGSTVVYYRYEEQEPNGWMLGRGGGGVGAKEGVFIVRGMMRKFSQGASKGRGKTYKGSGGNKRTKPKPKPRDETTWIADNLRGYWVGSFLTDRTES